MYYNVREFVAGAVQAMVAFLLLLVVAVPIVVSAVLTGNSEEPFNNQTAWLLLPIMPISLAAGWFLVRTSSRLHIIMRILATPVFATLAIILLFQEVNIAWLLVYIFFFQGTACVARVMYYGVGPVHR